ncbi:MAG TPA: M28 family peptidase [Gaiellaceae bacterium]|nr:M28 family peptidase [Gaiellaceae bacterium]
MEAARPRRRRRRPRPGTLDRPLNTRLVRVSFLAVAPALLALLFSISETRPLPRPALEPLFDPEAAAELAGRLSAEHPARVPGTPEAELAAAWYADTMRELGLSARTDTWRAHVPGLGKVALRNVVTVVPGRSPQAIIVVAHRDNAGAGAPGDNASGTAVLIELARGFASQETGPAPLPERTLVLVSTDAGAWGGAGAVRFAATSPHARDALAAVVLGGVGGPGRPRLVLAGKGARSPARALVATAAARIGEQAGVAPALPALPAQLVDLGIPFAAGEQGPLLERGIAALTLTTQEPGEPRVPAGDPPGALSQQRLGQMGRATEALVGSIDATVGRAFRTPDSLFLGEQAASGWTVRLTLVAAVAPFALGVLDLLARSRRRRLPLTPAARALRARLGFWLFAGLLLWLGALGGIFPTGAALPPPTHVPAAFHPPAAGLTLLLLLLAGGWALARRPLASATAATAEERLAGHTVALAWLAVTAVALALVRPYALLFVLPSLYAWLWLPAARGPGARAALYLLGLAGPAAGLLVLAQELRVGVLEAAFYAVALATVGYLPLTSVLLGLAWAASAGQLGALAFGRYRPYAGGAHPPPARLRAVASALLRLARRRYASAR